MRTYAFKKPHLWLAAFATDLIGYQLKKPLSSKKINPSRILVVRVDQIGDVIQSLPVFSALNESFPNAKVDFLTTSIGKTLIEWSLVQPAVLSWDCSWFDKRRKDSQQKKSLMKELREKAYDVVLELRGDIRIQHFLRGCALKNIVSYGQTGGGFLLDVCADWTPGMPAIEKNITLVEAIGGMKPKKIDPVLRFGKASSDSAHVIVHPDAGAPEKKWDLKNFSFVIEALLKKNKKVTLVGLDKEAGDKIQSHVKGPVENLMGKTKFNELAETLSQGAVLLTNDSGPGHLMAALGRPVVVVWKGPSDPHVWAPRGEKVAVVNQADKDAVLQAVEGFLS